MSKVIILPDIHGRTFWKYALEHIDEFDKVIFLGDYLDPYPHEGITFDESVENFKEILEFKKNNIDNAAYGGTGKQENIFFCFFYYQVKHNPAYNS